MFAAALAAAAAGWGVRLVIEGVSPIVQAVFVLGAYGAVYFGVAALLGLEQSGAIVGRLRGLVRRK
jgi:hypothetical protein